MNLFRPLALAVPFVLAASGSAQTVQLRFKPPVGKTASYTMTMSMTMTSAMMPNPMSFSQSIPMTIKVVSRTANTTTMQTKMGKATVTVPPNSPMAGMKAQMEKASSGMTSTTTVDEFGNLKNMNAAGGSAAAAAMTRQMGAGMMQGAQGISYPKKALKVGDTWGATMDMGKIAGGMMGGAMKMNGAIPITYRLTALNGGVATIAVTMKGATTMNMGPNSMKMNLSSKGLMTVEAATGLLKSMATTTDTDMSMGAQGSMKQHMVMTMKGG